MCNKTAGYLQQVPCQIIFLLKTISYGVSTVSKNSAMHHGGAILSCAAPLAGVIAPA
jgi:predicted outer membrane repeat protein